MKAEKFNELGAFLHLIASIVAQSAVRGAFLHLIASIVAQSAE
jgi:hypothetical protein